MYLHNKTFITYSHHLLLDEEQISDAWEFLLFIFHLPAFHQWPCVYSEVLIAL
jgi:hypothetical protein